MSIRHALALTMFLSTSTATLTSAAAESALKIDVYNPGDKALFAVSSELVSGPTEVVLIDAQMRRADAEVLVARIKATHKRLKAVFVSQGDPDFYFGLETIRAAFSYVPVSPRSRPLRRSTPQRPASSPTGGRC